MGKMQFNKDKMDREKERIKFMVQNRKITQKMMKERQSFIDNEINDGELKKRI